MNVSVKKGSLAQAKADALIVTSVEGKSTTSLDRRLRAAVDEARSFGFRGQSGQAVWVSSGRLSAKRILVVGLGKASSVKPDTLRAAFGIAATACRKAGLRSVATSVPDLSAIDPEQGACALTEGVLLAGFDPEEFKTNAQGKGKPLTRVAIVESKGDRIEALRDGVFRGECMADGTILARTLVNRPANVLTPTKLAEAAKEIAKDYATVKCTVWGPKEIQRHKMGGIMGVGRGSAEPSQFVMLEYAPPNAPRSLPSIAFVGKGLTFDTGGISIKPAAGMEQMKFDMGGAAAVIGSFKILAELEPQVRVRGYVAAAENMPDGRAIKPGDLLEMMNGMTVEVNNTDAEGRLVLADALHYAKSQKPDFIIDAATLTGACMIALGDVACGLMSEDDDLVQLIQDAADRVDEPVWRLPLMETHRQKMKGHVADLINTGPREGGALTAAGFLSYFAKGARWAHLDIAGVVWTESDTPYAPKGATGYGARLFAQIAEAAANGA